jgi:hypothetical protein
MKPSIQSLGQILYSPSQYKIPVFQRQYHWQELQWEKLWGSLIEIQRPEKRGNHFMGFLIFVPGVARPGQHSTFHLIDGQQRLTTSSILLAALRNVAREMNEMDLADEIDMYYLVHPQKKGDQHYSLLPKECDHDSYLAIIDGKREAKGRTAEALAFFDATISRYANGAPERLRPILNTVLQRLDFMCTELEAENAYNIFKSLNSTGARIGSSDLIRNFIFLRVPPEDQDEFERKLWGPLEAKFRTADGSLDDEKFASLLRDFLMSCGRYVSPRETFATFEERYEAVNFSPKDLARSLLASVDDYAVITGREIDRDEGVTAALAGLNLLESSTSYPLLLTLFEKRRDGTLDDEQLELAVEMLRGFLLRRYVCGESSQGYGRMFVRALSKDDDDPLKSLNAFLLNRGWPDDARFEADFADFPIYSRGYAKEVLTTLETAHGHALPADLAATQVEHIMPRTLSPHWRTSLGAEMDRTHGHYLHKPGNLTLSAYNHELWNHPFTVKRQRYAQSNIGITRELALNERWTEAEIVKRSQKLAHLAARIWIGPKAQPNASAPTSMTESLALA